MSVINQMLRDLQARQSEVTESQRAAVAGISAAAQRDTARGIAAWWWVIPGAVLVVALVWAVWTFLPATRPLPETVPAEPPASTGEVASESSALAVTASPLPEAPVRPEIATLIGVSRPNGYRIELLLTAPLEDLPVLESGENGGHVEFDGVALRADVSAPDDPAAPVKSLRLTGEGRNAGLSYELSAPARVSFRRAPGARDTTRLWLEFVAEARRPVIAEPAVAAQPAEPVTVEKAAVAKPATDPVPVIESDVETVSPAETVAEVKRPAPPSIEEQAEAAYADAMNRLRGGDVPGAETRLREALNLQPGHRGAVEALAGLLLRDGRAEAASDLLASAMIRHPGDSALLQLYARSRHALNDVSGAVAVLEHGMATGRPGAEYYALLAALYQQQGDYEGAADLYGRALDAAPQNAAWWAGLGIALEGRGNPQEALEAYRRALGDASLAPRLRTYLNARVAALQ